MLMQGPKPDSAASTLFCVLNIVALSFRVYFLSRGPHSSKSQISGVGGRVARFGCWLELLSPVWWCFVVGMRTDVFSKSMSVLHNKSGDSSLMKGMDFASCMPTLCISSWLPPECSSTLRSTSLSPTLVQPHPSPASSCNSLISSVNSSFTNNFVPSPGRSRREECSDLPNNTGMRVRKASSIRAVLCSSAEGIGRSWIRSPMVRCVQC